VRLRQPKDRTPQLVLAQVCAASFAESLLRLLRSPAFANFTVVRLTNQTTKCNLVYPLFVSRLKMRRLLPLSTVALCTLMTLGCPTVDLGDSPPDVGQCRPDRAYFNEVIWPKYLAPTDVNRSCIMKSGCHSTDTGRSALRLSPLAAKLDTNYQVATRFLNCQSPLSSELLTKPLAGIEAHLGGDIFPNNTDPAVVDFRGWFP
jgi:hypothetical protein